MNNVSTERLDKVKVAITIEVDQEKFDAAVMEAYKSMGPRINVDGFRKGHAPKAIIEKQYGPEVFYEEAVNSLIPRVYIDVIKELEEIQPIAKPDMEIVQLEHGKPFIFKAIVDTKQEIELAEYKGLQVEKIDGEVTDEDLEQYLESLRSKHAVIEDVTDPEATVENGDSVLMDFCGKLNGEIFPGGTAAGYTLGIGSHSFIPGFEEQMIGMKVGEERNLDITFPEDYGEPTLAGKPVVFEVKVNGIKRQTLAPLDDEFAKDVSEFDTLDELKADAREKLAESKEEAVKMQYKGAVTELVTKDADVLPPESMVEAEAENYLNDLAFQMRQQGIPLEKYLELTNGSMDDVKAECRTRAEAFVKQRLVLEAIAEKEGIDVTEEEVDAEFGKLAEMYGQPVDQVKQVFTMQGQAAAVRRNVLLEKVTDFLLENAQIG